LIEFPLSSGDLSFILAVSAAATIASISTPSSAFPLQVSQAKK
jgi:hypothetical protein